ncbi:MAG: response regulator [Colwellia sp.]|nr:response regulator [Colwellia sp.]
MTIDKKRVILIVDDTPLNIEVLLGILKEKYRVKIAKNGEKALKIINTSPPDLVLLDVMMPEMDGYQVCQTMKNIPATATIPIIFVSAKNEPNEKKKALALGAVDYITKPVTPEEVLNKVLIHLS